MKVIMTMVILKMKKFQGILKKKERNEPKKAAKVAVAAMKRKIHKKKVSQKKNDYHVRLYKE